MANLEESHQLLGLDTSDKKEAATETEEQPWKESFKGVVAGFTAVFFRVVGVTNLQLLERRIPDLELNAFRSAAVLCCCFLWMLCTQTLPRLKLSDVPTMSLCAIVLSSVSLASNVSFALVPAATLPHCYWNLFLRVIWTISHFCIPCIQKAFMCE